LRIDDLFEKIGMDKLQYIKTYSAEFSAQKVFKKIPEIYRKNLKIPENYFFYRNM